MSPTNYGFHDNGIPIFSLPEKLESLKYCIDTDADEDALGHLGDLFHFVLERFNKGMQEDGQSAFSVRIAAEEWIISWEPTPIIGPSVLDQMARKLDD